MIIEMLSVHMRSIKGTHHGLFKRCVKIFILDITLIAEFQIGTNCAHCLAIYSFLCYATDFLLSLSADEQDEITDAFNATSRYLDGLLNIQNIYFTLWSIIFIHQNLI